MHLQRHRITQEAKFTYTPLGKAFEKQTKAIEEQGKKQVKALKALNLVSKTELKQLEDMFLQNQLNNIGRLKKW